MELATELRLEVERPRLLQGGMSNEEGNEEAQRSRQKLTCGMGIRDGSQGIETQGCRPISRHWRRKTCLRQLGAAFATRTR